MLRSKCKNDEYDDILFGSSNDQDGAYIVFGSNNTSDIDLTENSNRFISIGKNAGAEARSVNSAGDFNNDGYDDFVLSYLSEVNNQLTLEHYLVFNLNNLTQLTESPSISPTTSPTLNPTLAPTAISTVALSSIPTLNPSANPTIVPTNIPTITPSLTPTITPTLIPTNLPSNIPTKSPSFKPSLAPSKQPTKYPSAKPSFLPSKSPTTSPSVGVQTSNPTFDVNNLPPYVVNLSNKDLSNVESNDIVNVPLEIGDFNNDGLKDYFIYEQNGNNEGPVVTVGKIILSKSTSFLNNLNDDNNSENLIKLTYSAMNNFYPAVSGIGDYNLDGLSDIAFCLYSIQTCYIIYGTSLLEDIYLPNLDPSRGFKIIDTSQTYSPGTYFSTFGTSIAGDFDFDGDEKSDFMIGDNSYNSGQGRVYVILGKANLRTDIDLNLSPGQEGIVIFSGFVYGWTYKGYNGFTNVGAGATVISLGDFNGDGYDDIGISSLASIFVVYGSSDTNGFSLNAIPANRGFTYTGDDYGDTTLPSPRVRSIGDFNGDGLQDIAICHGIYQASGLSVKTTEVVTKVILGSSLNNNNPAFEIPNACSSMPGTEIGSAVKVNDVNGDGYDDFFISKTKPLSLVNTEYFFPSGYYYLVFGKSSSLNNINLDNFNSNQGVIFLDDNTYNVVDFQTSFQSLGNAVSVGDINKDGYADFLLSSSLKTYLIYGRSTFVKGSILFPSALPVTLPTVIPTFNNTSFPLIQPTSHPSISPTSQPSIQPTSRPSDGSKEIFATNRIYAILSREVYVNPEHTSILEEMNGNSNRIPSGWASLLSSYEALGNVGISIANWNFFAKSYKCLASGEVIVAFQGTDDAYDLISSDQDLAMGLIPNYYSLAKNFVDYLIQNMNVKLSKITFTGHSLGGYLAQLMTATYNRPAVVFESPGAGKVIDAYNNDPNYAISYSSAQIAHKIHCFNAAPNIVNIASGENFANVTRLYPEYDSSSAIFTLQQHDMTAIMLQFQLSDTPRIYANMENYWQFSGAKHNWPFYEMSGIFDINDLNNYLNNIFYYNYIQNPYYWEFVWDESPNVNSIFFRSTASRKAVITSGSLGSTINTLYKTGVEIQGNNAGNKFFGGTNYADSMNGGLGSDTYYPFSGMNKIKDPGGVNNYYFYTHNMRGTTEITDVDQSGKITFVNIGCGISTVYQVNDETNIFAFFPQFDTNCNLVKYSSEIKDLLSAGVTTINHKNDIVLLEKRPKELLISYNNKAFSDPTRDKILVKNFVTGKFGISLISNHGKYIAVGSDADDSFLCSDTTESILAGLSGTNTFFIPVIPNQYGCSIISSDDGKTVYKFYSGNSVTRKLFVDNIHDNTKIGTINLFGMKKTDIIDLSNLKLSNFSSLLYTNSGNGTLLSLPNGISITIDHSKTFLVTLDGNKFAFFNTSEQSYNTNIEILGFNITSLKQDLSAATSPYQYSTLPTIQPTTSIINDESNHHDMLSTEAIIGISIGGGAALLIGSGIAYVYGYNLWPFSSFSVIPTQDISDLLESSVEAGREEIEALVEEIVSRAIEIATDASVHGLELLEEGRTQALEITSSLENNLRMECLGASSESMV